MTPVAGCSNAVHVHPNHTRAEIITDGSGAEHVYANNMNCVWHVHGEVGQKLALVFRQMELQPAVAGSCVDKVEVFDGPSTAASSLGIFCGSTLPSVLRSSSNQLTVRFTTNGAVVSNGFRLLVGTSTPCNSTVHLSEVPGMILDESGSGDVAPNTNCTWRISPPGNRRVRLTMDYVSVNCANTELSVHGVHGGSLQELSSCPEEGDVVVANSTGVPVEVVLRTPSNTAGYGGIVATFEYDGACRPRPPLRAIALALAGWALTWAACAVQMAATRPAAARGWPSVWVLRPV